jgi:hypothetical protein
MEGMARCSTGLAAIRLENKLGAGAFQKKKQIVGQFAF